MMSENIPAQVPDKKIEEEENVVHRFFATVSPEVELIVDASNLSEQEKSSVRKFYEKFLSHLEDESYIERCMVSTGPLVPRDGETHPLRRIKLQDGTYSIGNSLYVFREFFNEAFGRTEGEMSEVRKAILGLLKESLNNQN